LRHPAIRRELLLAAVFLAAWIVPPFWKIVTLQTVNVQDDIFASDLWNDRLPTRAFVGASLRRGEAPTWMPGIYTGFPSLAQVECGALYPSNVALFTLLPPYVAIAWAQILPLAIAGFGMFLLASELGLALEARLFAAGVFALSGFLVIHFRQLNMVDAASWLPLLLAATERIAVRRAGRAPLALAVLWALEILAGHPQISYYAALLLGAYFGVRRWQLRREIPPGRFLRDAASSLALPLVLGTLVAGAQLLPASELARLTYREGGLAFEAATQFPVSPLSFSTFFAPSLFGDARTDSFALSGLYWEQYAYLGIAAPLFSIVAIVVSRREPHVRLWAAIGLVGFVLALGRNTPLFGLAFRFIPGMNYFRFPSRFLLFTEIAVALLASVGLAATLQAVPVRARRAVAASVLALTAADLWFHQARQVPQVEWDRWLGPFGTERTLRAARDASSQPWRYYTVGAQVIHGGLYHAAHGYGGDLTPFLQARTMLQPSFNLLFGLEAPDGYSNLVPRYYEAVWGSEKKPGIVGAKPLETRALAPELANVLRLFNVRFVLSVVRLDSEALRHVETTPEGVEIYELDGWLPRAFVVGDVDRSDDDATAIAALTSPSFTPASRAIVSGALTLPPGAEGSSAVRITRRSSTEMAVHASLTKPGLLVVSEGYYPGWRAAVDGSDAPIHRVNLMMRGVVLEAGEHDVVFRFRSATIATGTAISLAALAALVLLRRRLTLA
jgi:hypothetical protein